MCVFAGRRRKQERKQGSYSDFFSPRLQRFKSPLSCPHKYQAAPFPSLHEKNYVNSVVAGLLHNTHNPAAPTHPHFIELLCVAQDN